MISGFTHPTKEFTTPTGSSTATPATAAGTTPLHRFDHHDFLRCPRHANTPRQFECTRLITADQVKQLIRTIPGFGTTPRP
jgi:autotransporter strand-loop-strand O-heptosyltransferase